MTPELTALQRRIAQTAMWRGSTRYRTGMVLLDHRTQRNWVKIYGNWVDEAHGRICSDQTLVIGYHVAWCERNGTNGLGYELLAAALLTGPHLRLCWPLLLLDLPEYQGVVAVEAVALAWLAAFEDTEEQSEATCAL